MFECALRFCLFGQLSIFFVSFGLFRLHTLAMLKTKFGGRVRRLRRWMVACVCRPLSDFLFALYLGRKRSAAAAVYTGRNVLDEVPGADLAGRIGGVRILGSVTATTCLAAMTPYRSVSTTLSDRLAERSLASAVSR